MLTCRNCKGETWTMTRNVTSKGYFCPNCLSVYEINTQEVKHPAEKYIKAAQRNDLGGLINYLVEHEQKINAIAKSKGERIT